MSNGVKTFRVKRKMALEGRMNLIFESLGKSQTRVTANTKYVLTRDVQAIDGANVFKLPSDVIGFNTGGAAVFPTTTKTDVRAANRPSNAARPGRWNAACWIWSSKTLPSRWNTTASRH